MNRNWIAGLLITGVSTVALIFIIKGNLNFAVLCMTALFALSNGYRAFSFKQKGYVREAKWMKWMSVFFISLFVIVLLTIIF